MKALLISITIIMSSIIAGATELQPEADFSLYLIQKNDLATNKLMVTYEFATEDTCNSFGIDGDMAMIQPELSLLIGIYNITQTEIACPKGEPRTISLEKEISNLPDGRGEAYLLMIPSLMKLNMVPQ
jgi:hypothetical protein